MLNTEPTSHLEFYAQFAQERLEKFHLDSKACLSQYDPVLVALAAMLLTLALI
jgi:hypothetical protein